MMRDIKIDAVEYAAGETIPEWLLQIDPKEPGACIDCSEFAQTTSIVEISSEHLVIPANPNQPTFNITGRGRTSIQTGEGVTLMLPKSADARECFVIAIFPLEK